MKNVLLLVMLVCLSMQIWAQTTIANGGFENWTGSGTSIEPQFWNSNKTGGGNASSGPQTCFQESSNPRSGTYCARVVTGNTLGIVVNGSLTTGRVEAPSFNKSEGYIRTIPTNPDYRMPFTGRPDSIVFWYRYTRQGSDYPRVEARLHVGFAYAPEAPVNNNHPDSTVNIIARAQWQGPSATVSSWTRISLPFVYVDGRTPQYILVTTTSSGDQTGGTNGSIMWLDDFEAIYNPTITTGVVSPLTYYVSATNGATISVPYTLTGTFNTGNTVTAQLSDASGSFASPTTIGSATSTTSGTISATIPANTTTGTGYRVRVVSNNPSLIASNNGSNISIQLVATSIAPTTAQTIAVNSNGSALLVTESAGAISREWKYASTSGGPYVSINPAQTGVSYTPVFTAPGTYYVVCTTTYPNNLIVTSNEVIVNVVGNSIAPSSPQSILVGVNGNTLTVTETPAGMWREWLFATQPGGPYGSFSPALTGVFTYTPNFVSPGNYYVVCQSEISGVFTYSNEVLISVGNATITTGSVGGSPFELSPSAVPAPATVPFVTSGTFNVGNVFTAQLSDTNGSFSNATDIGTLSAVSSGTIAASVPPSTPAGTGYRIRVISSNPVILGSDNGVNLVVDQFNNSIAPASIQTIQHSTNGSPLTVTASQAATHEWKYTTTSGSGYISFTPTETGTSYTPNFALPGVYFVAVFSKNQFNDEVSSNEVEVNVTNGSTLTTLTVTGSPYLVSASANVQLNVPFSSDVVFNVGNEFKAELSDNAGSFASPIEIGTLSGSTISPVPAVIPNNSVSGAGYRIRVVSTDPALTGTDNGTDLVIVPFEISVSPTDTQTLFTNQDGNAISVTETHTTNRNWMYSEVSGLGYTNFNPAQTGTSCIPRFNLPSTYYVICKSKNSLNDEVTSEEVVVLVTLPNSVNETEAGYIKAFWNGNDFIVDLSTAQLSTPTLELYNVSGQIVLKESLKNSVNRVGTNLPNGTYIFKITDGVKQYKGTTNK